MAAKVILRKPVAVEISIDLGAHFAVFVEAVSDRGAVFVKSVRYPRYQEQRRAKRDNAHGEPFRGFHSSFHLAFGMEGFCFFFAARAGAYIQSGKAKCGKG